MTAQPTPHDALARAIARWALDYPISVWRLATGKGAEQLARNWGEVAARHVLKDPAVIPAIRAQVTDDLRHQLQAKHDRVRDLEGATLSEERKIARHQGALAEAIRMLDHITRGDQ